MVPVVVEILPALQVGEVLDPLVLPHPELRGGELDVVDQEDLALTAGREIRHDGAGGQHVEAAADHRLEQLEAGGELDRLELDALASRSAVVDAGPDLAVHRRRVQVAQLDLGLGLARRLARPTVASDAAVPAAASGPERGADAWFTSVRVQLAVRPAVVSSMSSAPRQRSVSHRQTLPRLGCVFLPSPGRGHARAARRTVAARAARSRAGIRTGRR